MIVLELLALRIINCLVDILCNVPERLFVKVVANIRCYSENQPPRGWPRVASSLTLLMYC